MNCLAAALLFNFSSLNSSELVNLHQCPCPSPIVAKSTFFFRLALPKQVWICHPLLHGYWAGRKQLMSTGHRPHLNKIRVGFASSSTSLENIDLVSCRFLSMTSVSEEAGMAMVRSRFKSREADISSSRPLAESERGSLSAEGFSDLLSHAPVMEPDDMVAAEAHRFRGAAKLWFTRWLFGSMPMFISFFLIWEFQ